MIVDVEYMSRAVVNGFAISKQPLSSDVLTKIKDGFAKSPRTTNAIKVFIAKNSEGN